MVECLFCKIIEGREPSYKIAESRNFQAILNIYPAAPGHTLIIAKNHSENMLAVPTHLGTELLELSQHVAKQLMNCTGADGFNFLLNNGPTAGQVVMHTHFHIIPRRQNDGVHGSFESKGKAAPEELQSLQKLIVRSSLM